MPCQRNEMTASVFNESGLETDKFDVEIRILRSNRRSVVGQVLPNGNVEVRAPLSMTTEKINKWLDRFESTFLPIVRRHRKINAYMAEHPFGYGGEVLLKGEWVPIREAKDNNNGCMVQYKDGAVVMKPGLCEADMRFHISDLFFNIAKPLYEKMLHYYSDVMGVEYKTWTIGNARKIHGSCNSNNKITLSWLVVMMCESVIECIVVHELAHLKHMNHSKAFRDEVAAVLPDWKERRKTYDEYYSILRCGGWI